MAVFLLFPFGTVNRPLFWTGQLLEAVRMCLEPSTHRLVVPRSGVHIEWSHNFVEVDSPKAFFLTSENEFRTWLAFTDSVPRKRMGQVAALSPTGIGSDRRAFQGDLADALILVC